ncbi:MFS transporter [Vulcanisaeta distributa]|uniref:Major facilitator superfamily MFS_1 n=1 Tax=Vulcanisaeta distributa (strain DSM 14429 / JCM 11212 / NBRC 100878 / IC-017) TaxID=572478 RepID=E1QQA0_VULDI|nr:MFS transporter [Vulcanisaeta distributa]ADN51587.1 major facilitator superfamily MFS_1 [Vulcanisaeta distributa DSM 14429]
MKRSIIVIIIMLARVIYSAYWFYLAPALPIISIEFKVNKALLGLVPFAFIVGAASFQIPAGIIASRLGNAKTAGLGLFAMAITGLLIPFSTNFYEVLILRLIAGIGAALFFSTGAAILSTAYPERVGTLLGIYNAAFGLGSGIGLAWGITYAFLGWRLSTLLLSAVGVPLALTVFFVQSGYIHSPRIRFSRDAVIIGIATSGFWGTYITAGNLLPTYAVGRGLPLYVSSLLTSIMLFSSIFGGLSGRIIDAIKNRVLLIVVLTIVGTVPLITIPTLNVAAIVIAGGLMGFTNELALTAAYALVARHENPTLSLATLNALNMIIGMWLSILFTETMVISYSLPWILMILISLALLPLLKLVSVT